MFAEAVALVFMRYLTLVCWSWTSGFVLGSVSRRIIRVNGVLFCLRLLFGELLGAPRYFATVQYLRWQSLHRAFPDFASLPDPNAPGIALTFYRAMFPLIVHSPGCDPFTVGNAPRRWSGKAPTNNTRDLTYGSLSRISGSAGMASSSPCSAALSRRFGTPRRRCCDNTSDEPYYVHSRVWLGDQESVVFISGTATFQMEEVRMEEQELAEAAEKAQRPEQKQVGITMAVGAVLLAIATMLAHRAHTEEVLLQTRTNDQWGYYQAKNNRSAMYAADAKLALLMRAEGQRVATEFTNQADEQKRGSEEVRQSAEKLEEETRAEAKRANYFDLAEVSLEATIVLCSITLLSSSLLYWKISFASTAVGVFLSIIARIR